MGSSDKRLRRSYRTRARSFIAFTVGIGVVVLAALMLYRMWLVVAPAWADGSERLHHTSSASRAVAVQWSEAYAVVKSTHSIMGQVRDGSGNPYGGVWISASGGYTTVTNASGWYTFTELVPGTYLLRPSMAGYIFEPPARTVTLPPSAVAQDFTIVPGAAVYVPLVVRGHLSNQPPQIPFDPTPSDGATDQSVDVNLRWSGGDPDGDGVTFDVYFAADDSTPELVVCDDVINSSCDPGTLSYGVRYYWQVIAKDEYGATAAGPIWNFETEALPPAGWLEYINYYRAMARLPAVIENPSWSNGCWLHARYIVKNDALEHDEDPLNPWYTPEGQAAAQSSNLMASSQVDETDQAAIDVWMQAPFHAVGILDPALSQAGLGSYREADGGFHMAAVLDVIRGLGSIPPAVTFPIQWPADGMTVALTTHWGEYPNPLASCPGYTAPSGLPIILQIGAGNLTPDVTDHSFMRDDTALDHCVFDETSYASPDDGQQAIGRSILNARDAIVLIPRDPLIPGASYTASITANGQAHTWSFTVSPSAQNVTQFRVR